MAEQETKPDSIQVEVAFALPERQEIKVMSVARGCTAARVVEQSGLLEKYASFLPETGEPTMGIFSRPLNGVELPLPSDYELQENDRVEIYRPLEKDPKQTRLERAARVKKSEKGKQGKK